MPTAEDKPGARRGFAVWLTGLPASGKSTIAEALHKEIAGHGMNAAVLESDVLRRILTPNPTYGNAERGAFYEGMLRIGELLTGYGVPIIFDATAHRRVYRDAARRRIPRFLEVYVDTPLPVCQARDPKGIYRRAREGKAANVPGVQSAYEPPLLPEIVVRADREPPEEAARRIVSLLVEKGYLEG